MEMICFASSTAVIYSGHQDLLFSHKYTDMLKVQDSQTQSQEAAFVKPDTTTDSPSNSFLSNTTFPFLFFLPLKCK